MADRRSFIRGLAVLPLAGTTLPASAAMIQADPLLDLLQRSNALVAYAHTTPANDPTADEAMDQADAIQNEAFHLRATTPTGALASLQWARDEFARYYVTEKMDDDPDWMDRLTLNMLDSELGILRPMIEGGRIV